MLCPKNKHDCEVEVFTVAIHVTLETNRSCVHLQLASL